MNNERNSRLAALALVLGFVGVSLVMGMAFLRQKPACDNYQWQPQDHWLSASEEAELQRQIDYLHQCRQLSAAEVLNFLDLFGRAAVSRPAEQPEKPVASSFQFNFDRADPLVSWCLREYMLWKIWPLGCEDFSHQP